jgi:DNA-binding NarL/FixJ family response regulator
VRVVIIADNPLARLGLAALLADQPGYSVVGQIAGEVGSLADLDFFKPDILIWDLDWDVRSTLERLADLKSSRPPIVALLADDSSAGEAWGAGVQAILRRDADGETLAAALRAVLQGLVVMDSGLAASVTARDRAFAPSDIELTAREREVLQLLAEGLPNKTIAQRLAVSEHTVKFHVNALMGKLSAQSRTEAVTRAARLGLITF